MPYLDSYSEETATAFNKMFTHFPLIKKQMKQIEFENVYKSSIRFSLFLYTHIPDKSPSYALLQRTLQTFKARWFDLKFNEFCKKKHPRRKTLPKCVAKMRPLFPHIPKNNLEKKTVIEKSFIACLRNIIFVWNTSLSF